MKDIKKRFKEIFHSKKVFQVSLGLGFFVIALLIFQAGVAVGFHKGGFNREWQNHYFQNFGPRPQKGMFFYKFPNAHGAVGKIIKLDLPNMVVEGPDNIEKSVSIGVDTKILKFDTEIQAETLVPDDFVVVIGNPNEEGQVAAKIIRVLPQPTGPFMQPVK